MIINNEPDQEVKTKMVICDFHKKNPGKPYAGCTCSRSYTLKKKEKEEFIFAKI